MAASGTLVGCRLFGRLEEKYAAYKENEGISSDTEAIRNLLAVALDACGAEGRDELLGAAGKASARAARFSAAAMALAAMQSGRERLDYAHLDIGQRAELAMAAAGALLAQKGNTDIDRALAQGRRELRRKHAKEGAEGLLRYMASLNSQIVFNAIDPRDLEEWISSMMSYRRGEDGGDGFSYEVGRQHLRSILADMGIRTAASAREKFNGQWRFSKEAGWVLLCAEALEDAEPVIPAQYTDAFDALDPHPENYSVTGAAAEADRIRHERWVRVQEG